MNYITYNRKRRTIVKAISYRILGTFLTMSIVFIFTQKLSLSLGVGVVETLSKVVAYYIHERVWEKSSWGVKHKT